ncbi:MAG: lysylphosphatidylglycerol synthase transmembrane domain-containing protein [Thermoleophilaceae bacterium]
MPPLRGRTEASAPPEGEPEPQELDADEEIAALEEDEAEDHRVAALLSDHRRMASVALVFVVGVVGIYLVLPKIVGFDDSLSRIHDAEWYWVVVAVLFCVAQFVAYVALFRGVLGGKDDSAVRRRLDTKVSYQITMAGLAATRIFSAAGAGGILLTYWALRKAAMPRRRSACRMVAFLVLTYSVYLAALIVFGVLLRTGVLPGDDPVGGTIVPAGVAGAVILVLGLVALIPGDVERRLSGVAGDTRAARLAQKLATGPPMVATGVRTAVDYIAHPSRGALAVAGAVGFWAAQIGILWASFEAFGASVPFAVLVQGFFVGMAANLIPSPAGGVGSVDAGMIGAFVLFGVDKEVVFPAVLTYRVIAFWLPIPPGVIAYFQLRRTVARWEGERRGSDYTSQSKVKAEAT